VEPNHVESGRWNHRADARDEVEGLPDDGVGAVLSGPFHGVLDGGVVSQGVSVLRDRRPRQVPAHSLHARLVARVEGYAWHLIGLTQIGPAADSATTFTTSQGAGTRLLGLFLAAEEASAHSLR
jgi:hypothetical protein